MKFENSFDVPLPPADAWKVLMDIERIAPCMPGAELTAKVDDRTYKGKVGVKLGPVALSFAGTAAFEEIDDTAHRARIKASGADQKGRGGANAVATFRVEPSASGSRVVVDTDLNLSGSVAQYGRGAGMIQEVAAQLIRQFSATLREQIAAERPAPAAEAAANATTAGVSPPPPRPTAGKPISGFRLFATVIWNQLRRILGLGLSS
jgi:carbon monoxide dehydrogenase subunit G